MADDEKVTNLAKTLVEKRLAPSYDEAIVLARKFLEMDAGSVSAELAGKNAMEASEVDESGSAEPESVSQNAYEPGSEEEKTVGVQKEGEIEANRDIIAGSNSQGLSQNEPAAGDNGKDSSGSNRQNHEKPAIVGNDEEGNETSAAGLYAFVKYYEGIRLEKTGNAFEKPDSAITGSQSQQERQNQPEQHAYSSQSSAVKQNGEVQQGHERISQPQQTQQAQNQHREGQSEQPQNKGGNEKEEDSGISITDFFNVNRLPGKDIPKGQ